MNERGRKRSSKWDLIDGKISLEDNDRVNIRDGDYRASSNERKYYSGRPSSGHAADDNTKDIRSKYEPDLTDRDRASEYRSSRRNNSFDRDNKGFSEAGTNWNEDESKRDHTRSPKSSWQMPVRSRSRGKSRSRSRSPVTIYRHESDMNDRRRSRPEVPIQTCRDFTSGRCRRGSHCPFLHPSSQNFEDRRYEYEHREESYRGGNYSHYNASDGQYNDFTRDTIECRREYDRNNRGEKREPRRSDDIPCTFFAAGNCRNGKFCRFSHQIQTAHSSGERARDERWIKTHSPEKVSQVDRGTKFSDNVDLRDERLRKNHSQEKIGQVDSGNNSVDPRNERWRKNHSPEKIGQVDSGTELNSSVDPRNERWRKNQSPEKIGQVDWGEKFSTTDYAKEGRWGTTCSPGRVSQIDRGMTFSETADPHVIAQGRESQTKKNSSSMSSGWASNMEVDYAKNGVLTNADKLVNVKANQPPQWKSDNRDNVNNSSELKGVVNWIGDKMSPERNPKVELARTFVKDKPSYAIQKSDSVSHIVPSQKESQRTNNVQSEMQNNVEKAISQQIFNPINDTPGAFSYDKNVGSQVGMNFNSSFASGNSAKPSTQDVLAGVPGNLNAAGQEQYMCAPNFPGNEDGSVIKTSTTNYNMHSVKPNCEDPKTPGVTFGATPTSTLASQANLTDLSASLAHLLGKGQQLPQLYTAINPLNVMSSVDTSNRIVSQFSLESVKPYPPSDSKEPNQPVCDNTRKIELAQNHSNQGLLRTSKDVKQETPSAGQNAGEAYNNGCTEDLGHKADAYSEPKTNPQTTRVESTQGKDKPAELREGSPLGNMGREGKVGGVKKGKESKALRDFKYALVNFVKELLKTAWKDGQIDKEGYKTIVKKVVDKVTGTIQETSIPQTSEKVEHYLSASKPKLMKLVQAYVERNPKKQVR